MMSRRLLTLLVLIVCCAASVAAQRGRKPATHTVTIDGTAFKPAALTIKAGDTVVWVNKDIVAHTATSSASKVFESRALDTGKSWKKVFTAKGDFPYFCRFYPTMKASLKVE